MKHSAGRRFHLINLCARAVLLGALAHPMAAVAKRPVIDDANYGPPPSWEEYKTMAENAVRSRLVDPDSAKFKWRLGFHKGGFSPFFSRPIFGYVACGEVNSKNRMGGYTGNTTFIVDINFGAVLAVDFGNSQGSGYIDQTCATGIKQGLFPPLPSDMASSTSVPGSATEYGFQLVALPEGGLISAIISGSPAETAGLRPGSVITSFNGVSLKGMTMPIIVQMINASAGTASIELADGRTLKVDRGAASLLPEDMR